VPAIGGVAAAWRPILSALGTRDDTLRPPTDDAAAEAAEEPDQPVPITPVLDTGPELAPA
jgi:hypothetical protein